MNKLELEILKFIDSETWDIDNPKLNKGKFKNDGKTKIKWNQTGRYCRGDD